MNPIRFFNRSTLSMAVLSAFLLAGTAQGAVLGGQGSLGGGIGARGIDLAGQGAPRPRAMVQACPVWVTGRTMAWNKPAKRSQRPPTKPVT
jgi:hypothetical protein